MNIHKNQINLGLHKKHIIEIIIMLKFYFCCAFPENCSNIRHAWDYSQTYEASDKIC